MHRAYHCDVKSISIEKSQQFQWNMEWEGSAIIITFLSLWVADETRIATVFNDNVGCFVCSEMKMIIYGAWRLSLDFHQPQSSANVTHPIVAVNWDVIPSKQRKPTFFIKNSSSPSFKTENVFVTHFAIEVRAETPNFRPFNLAQSRETQNFLRISSVGSETDDGWQGKWRWSASRWIKISFVLGDCYLESAVVCV